MRNVVHLVFLAVFAAAGLAVSSAAVASEGGYVKKWIWTEKEKKEVDEIEKKIEKTPEGMFKIETEHWIINTQIDTRFTAELAKFMEMYYATLSEIFNFKTGEEVEQKVTIVVFNNEGGYMQACGIPGSRGVFTHSTMMDPETKTFQIWHLYTYMEADRLLTFSNCYLPVIQHEGTHATIQRMLGEKLIPNWLNEGCATFYEYWDLRTNASPSGKSAKDKDARLKRLQTSPTKHDLRENIKENNGVYPTLAYLVGLKTHEEWNVDGMGPRTRFHYSLAESFADFLISSKDGAKWMKTMFERAVKEEDVLTEAEIAQLEPQWYAFLKGTWGINGTPPNAKGKVGKTPAKSKGK